MEDPPSFSQRLFGYGRRFFNAVSTVGTATGILSPIKISIDLASPVVDQSEKPSSTVAASETVASDANSKICRSPFSESSISRENGSSEQDDSSTKQCSATKAEISVWDQISSTLSLSPSVLPSSNIGWEGWGSPFDTPTENSSETKVQQDEIDSTPSNHDEKILGEIFNVTPSGVGFGYKSYASSTDLEFSRNLDGRTTDDFCSNISRPSHLVAAETDANASLHSTTQRNGCIGKAAEQDAEKLVNKGEREIHQTRSRSQMTFHLNVEQKIDESPGRSSEDRSFQPPLSALPATKSMVSLISPLNVEIYGGIGSFAPQTAAVEQDSIVKTTDRQQPTVSEAASTERWHVGCGRIPESSFVTPTKVNSHGTVRSYVPSSLDGHERSKGLSPHRSLSMSMEGPVSKMSEIPTLSAKRCLLSRANSTGSKFSSTTIGIDDVAEMDRGTLECKSATTEMRHKAAGHKDGCDSPVATSQPFGLPVVSDSTSAAASKAEALFEEISARCKSFEQRGMLSNAQSLYEESLGVLIVGLGEGHKHTLECMFCLANLYIVKKEYQRAEPLCLRVFEVRQRICGGGQNEAEVLLARHHLGTLYAVQCKYDLAEPLFEANLIAYRRLVGDEHANTLHAINDLASLYWAQGKYDLAEPLLVKNLEVRRLRLGVDHPDTLVSMHNLVCLYESRGKLTLIEPLYVRSFVLHRVNLGEGHPKTLSSMFDLACYYLTHGELDQAEQWLAKNLDLRRKRLGPQHRDTLASMNNLASLYLMQRRYDKAEPMYRQNLEIRASALGEEHPDTLHAINDLAGLYWVQEKYHLAEPLYVKNLEVRRRRLGKTHPCTIESVENLACLYESQGNVELIEPLFASMAVD